MAYARATVTPALHRMVTGGAARDTALTYTAIMKPSLSAVMVLPVLVGIGVAGSACYNDTQASVNHNMQRELRPGVSSATAAFQKDVPPASPPDATGFTRSNDLKPKGRP